MEDIQENLFLKGIENQLHVARAMGQEEAFISKALGDSEDIEKGGKAAVFGEERIFGGKKYKKTDKGWRPVAKGSGSEERSHELGELGQKVVGKTLLLGRNKRKVKVDSFDGTTFYVTDLSGAKNPLQSFGKHAHDQWEIAEEGSGSAAPKQEEKSDETPSYKGKHIQDMSYGGKLTAAKALGIKDPYSLSKKELDNKLIDANVEKQLNDFKKRQNK